MHAEERIEPIRIDAYVLWILLMDTVREKFICLVFYCNSIDQL